MTRQDRQHIAAGLAEGLTYSEMAEQLARPVSTISREVLRNGGRDSYQPDQAHRATGERARRSRRASSGPAVPAPPAMSGRDPQQVRDFEERFSAIMVATGLPRMAARVLSCLYTTNSGNLTAAELVQRLQVSPASISKAIADLEAQELVRRERDPRRRRDRYVIDEDAWFQSWLASARMLVMLADTAREGAEILDAGTPAGTRLEDMGRFLSDLGQDMIRAGEHRRALATRRTTGHQRG